MTKRIDVAKLAGVSEATVSRVFNNVGPIREETKQKVFEAANALNYQPNAIAQSFAKGKSGNIGVIVPYLPKVHLLSTYYFSEILSGIGMKLGEHQYNLLLLFQTPNEHKDNVQLFQSQKVDGCIILGARDVPSEKEDIARLHTRGLPYCLVNQTFDDDEPFNSIDAKHYDGSFEAVSLLIKKGYKRIAFLNGPMEYSNSSERLKGYQEALRIADIPLKDNWVFEGNYSRSSGLKIAQEIGSMLSEVDAVFAGNDRMAIGLMQGLGEQGFQIGQDYALIGYDDSDVASIIQPQLSSVHVPLFEMGQMAAERVLQALLQGKTESYQERLPVYVVERQSSNRINRG
ncbi:LacI family DNA-binding transcriptional regulator [Anaerobacillus sp. CMMVII]|nr:LacI family DNA-binding transcriptional regulator [Anaerobacillus sp. CMMVII]